MFILAASTTRQAFQRLRPQSATQIEAQRSGFDLERRSDGVNERRRKKRRRERYEVRDDVELVM